jgi:hypothetical protein
VQIKKRHEHGAALSIKKSLERRGMKTFSRRAGSGEQQDVDDRTSDGKPSDTNDDDAMASDMPCG